MSKPHPNHPTLALVKQNFSDVKCFASEFRGQTTLVVPPEHLHTVMQFLRRDPACDYNFLADVIGVDYLNYPKPADGPSGRFGVTYNLVSYTHNHRLYVKVFLDPTVDTSGIEHDPALHLASVSDIWPGAEWPEREVYDMFGIRFEHHPDLRRILTWEDFPAYPLRKDYPLRGRGERESFRVVQNDGS